MANGFVPSSPAPHQDTKTVNKVIVIDMSRHLYPILLGMDNVDIILLCCPSAREKEFILKSHPQMIVFESGEPSRWDKTYVSNKDILKYKSTQLKVERFMQRWGINPSYAISQYYHALAFWIANLSKEDIDCVVVGGDTEHGSLLDSVPMDVAKSLNIPVFLFDTLYANDRQIFKAVKCHNSGDYLNLKKIDKSFTGVNFRDVIFPTKIKEEDCHIFDKIDKIESHTLRSVIKLSITLHSRIMVFIKKSLGIDSNYSSEVLEETELLHRLFILLSSILYDIGFHRLEDTFPQIAVGGDCSHLIKNMHYISKIRRKYRNLSKNIVDFHEDCIIYMLHFEPEASFMNRTTYDSQIYNIEMLSATLPEGWKLYVKEHPHQFKVFNSRSMYFFKQIPIYRDQDYYTRLSMIKNVLLLDDRVKSSEILNKEHHQKIHAIATINGTISAECMYSKMPVILFDKKSTVYKNIKNLFSVSNIDDLKEIFSRLQTTPLIDYDSFDVEISQYLIKETADSSSNEVMHVTPQTLTKIFENSTDIANSSEKQ